MLILTIISRNSNVAQKKVYALRSTSMLAKM